VKSLVQNWDARGTAHENDFFNLVLFHFGVIDSKSDLLHASFNKWLDYGIKLRPRHCHSQVKRVKNVFLLDFGAEPARQLQLSLLAQDGEFVHGAFLLAKVNLLVLLIEYLNDVGNERVVDVAPAKIRVTARRLHVNDAVLYYNDRDVECTAAKVENEYIALLLRLQFDLVRVGQSGSCRLIDNAQARQAGDAASVPRRSLLRRCEVGRHRDDRLSDLLAGVPRRNPLHLPEDKR